MRQLDDETLVSLLAGELDPAEADHARAVLGGSVEDRRAAEEHESVWQLLDAAGPALPAPDGLAERIVAASRGVPVATGSSPARESAGPCATGGSPAREPRRWHRWRIPAGVAAAAAIGLAVLLAWPSRTGPTDALDRANRAAADDVIQAMATDGALIEQLEMLEELGRLERAAADS